MPSDVDLWADFDEAYADVTNCALADASHDDDGAGAEDDWGVTAAERARGDMCSRVVRLPDGDVHVCDSDCPYATVGVDDGGRPNGDCVCYYTGRVVARVCEERTDMSTGRSTWSVDPDMQGGGGFGGQWRKKRDVARGSRHAYVSAQGWDDTQMPEALHASSVTAPSAKRGALCVDEVTSDEPPPKRCRMSKKDVHSTNTLGVLIEEAHATFTKLLGKQSRTEQPPVDERLLDFDLLFHGALRKYLKEIASRGARPCMDDIHNIALAVDGVISAEKRKHADRSEVAFGKGVGGTHFRNEAARLAVAMWSSACSTTYLSKARRGGDSFKPFCAGVFVAMKRGMSLADGTVIVPRVNGFSAMLPSPKTIASNPALKSLHASGHRGLCTLHRCIAAAGSSEESRRIFSEAIRISKLLS